MELKIKTIKKLQKKFDLDADQCDQLKTLFETSKNPEEVRQMRGAVGRAIKDMQGFFAENKPVSVENFFGSYYEELLAQVNIAEWSKLFFSKELAKYPELHGKTHLQAYRELCFAKSGTVQDYILMKLNAFSEVFAFCESYI